MMDTPPSAARSKFPRFVGLLALGGATVWGLSQLASTSKPTHTSGPGDQAKDQPLTKLEGYQVREWVSSGAKQTDDLQTVVVLHDRFSSADAAQKALAGWPGKARFVAPSGQYVEESGFTFVDPSNPSPAAALQSEGQALTKFLAAVRQARSPGRRLVVVGIGVSSPLALAMALFAGFVVREGFGVGGSFDPALVPLFGGDTAIRLLTQAAGPDVEKTSAAFKLAASRGYVTELDVADFAMPPSDAVVQEWLFPRLEKAVAA